MSQFGRALLEVRLSMSASGSSRLAQASAGFTVRLFFTVGGVGILRVTVSVLFCSGVVLRGYSVAWPLLLEARACVVV